VSALLVPPLQAWSPEFKPCPPMKKTNKQKSITFILKMVRREAEKGGSRL
jgi:hypothetical protein